jgi:hypothetical protein
MVSVNTNSKHGRVFDILIKKALNGVILDCWDKDGTTANELVYDPTVIRGLRTHM